MQIESKRDSATTPPTTFGRKATGVSLALFLAAATTAVVVACDDSSSDDLRGRPGPTGDAGGSSSGNDGGSTTNPDGGPKDHDAGGDASTTEPPLVYAFVGHANEGWIQVFEVDAAGAWTFKSKLESLGEPNWIDVDTTRNRVFATDGATAKARVFNFDKATGKLTQIGDGQALGGAGPAHLSVDPTGKWVFAAMYSAGAVSTVPVAADGMLGAKADTEMPGAQAHWAGLNPSGGFLFVPCVAPNLIARYTVDTTDGTLTALTPFNMGLAGPRHMVFHPTEKFAYVVNEPDSSISVLGFDKATGALTAIEKKTTLPAGFMATNSGAGIAMHPSGKFVYTSNRGHHSIAAFSIDATTGKVTSIGHTLTGGETPRSFDLTPDGKYLYAGNEGSPGSVHGMEIDQTTGALTSMGATPSMGIPTVVRVFAFPR